MNETNSTAARTPKAGYNRFLLLVAGLGGLLYGVDVGIIAGALPYMEATFKDVATGQTLNAGQLSSSLIVRCTRKPCFLKNTELVFGSRPPFAATNPA